MALKVKNWTDFQHYKDRSPPWIKLHKGLLDDYEYQCLPVASRALAPMIWLLASEQVDGAITDDLQKIAFRLRMRVEDVKNALEPLIHAGFILSDSNVLADRKQVATPETETETETESVATRKRNSVFPKPEGIDDDLWDAFVQHRKAKKAPITEIAMAGIVREASKAGWTLAEAIREIIERNWQSFKAEWAVNSKSSGKSFAHNVDGVPSSEFGVYSRVSEVAE